MAWTTANSDHLIRSELWSTQLKEQLQETLIDCAKYVDWLTEFPDGTTFTIPSVGQVTLDDYVEDTAIKYRAMDTGEFQFSITEYVSAATYVTKKNKQDSFYMNKLMSTFVPQANRAIAERVERDILNLAMSQTLSNLNVINGANHRFVASGTNEVFTVNDFAKARYSLKKANVPDTNLIAIVDPSVEYTINTLSNLTNVSNNPRWEGVIESGIATGMRFVKNIFGFDVYVSNLLPDANETINAVTTGAGKANLFFSAASDVLPFVGAWRQMPEVDSSYNKDFQRDEYVTTARYGVKLYRPENLVCILADTDQV
jgi:hypothetical protein